jgi:hypothetical protein
MSQFTARFTSMDIAPLPVSENQLADPRAFADVLGHFQSQINAFLTERIKDAETRAVLDEDEKLNHKRLKK